MVVHLHFLGCRKLRTEVVHGMPQQAMFPLVHEEHDSVRRDDVMSICCSPSIRKLVQIALVVVLNGIQGSNRELTVC